MEDVKTNRLKAKTTPGLIRSANKDNEWERAISRSDRPVGGTPAVRVNPKPKKLKVSHKQMRLIRR